MDPELAQLGLDVVGPQDRDLLQLTTAASILFSFGEYNAALVFTYR